MTNEPLNLLIVDDSMAIRKILLRVLNQTNLPLGTIHEASDGKQALSILEQHNVSVVLSDINMPNMDGIELLKAIRSSERWQNLPVVLITTEGGQARVQEAAELGATSYVRKPFSADQLSEKLAGLFSK